MIEIQIGNGKNSNVFFQPLGRVLRGTYDLNNINEPFARVLINRFPKPIPGVILRLDGTTATVIEPLYAPEHAPIRERIEALGVRLPPEREHVEGVCVDTFVFWMKRLSDRDVSAKVIGGTWPEYDPTKAKKAFITEPAPNERENLVDKLLAMVQALVAERQGRKEMAPVGAGK
jgi:hypothetical protein